MPRLLFLVSSAREISIADGSPYPTGYFAEEALTPYERFTAAGVDVVVATPDGKPPYPDPYGLEPIFHYPDEDEDFFASVARTFHHDPDDIRLTLRHVTELGIMAARRVFHAMRDAGLSTEKARDLVNKAAKLAWRGDRNFADVLEQDGLAGPLSRAQIDEAVHALEADSQRLSDDRAARLAAIPGFQNPANLARLTDEEIAEFDAVFAPGGHGPMVDLADNPDVGRVIGILHAKNAPIASLCHGPAMLLSAPGRDDGQWLFDGYRLTCFTVSTAAGQVGESFFRGLKDGDVETAMSVVADDVEVDITPTGIKGTGPEHVRAFLEATVTAFPDLLVTTKRTFVGSDGVVLAELKVEGTQAADYLGIVNQEKHLDLDQAWRLLVADGKVRAITGFWCQNQLYRRLAVKRIDHAAIV
jgi:putative intracellular protease/amidase